MGKATREAGGRAAWPDGGGGVLAVLRGWCRGDRQRYAVVWRVRVEGETVAAAARAEGVKRRTASDWLGAWDRFVRQEVEGERRPGDQATSGAAA